MICKICFLRHNTTVFLYLYSILNYLILVEMDNSKTYSCVILVPYHHSLDNVQEAPTNIAEQE